MNNFYKRLIYKNGYLLILAGWFFTLSFVVGNYFNYNNTPLQVKHAIENDLHEQEDFFESVTSNMAVFSSFINADTDKRNLNIYKKSGGLFIYKLNRDSTFEKVFWNHFNMDIKPEELKYYDSSYFVHHSNGYYEFLKKTIKLDSNVYVAAGLVPIKSEYFTENRYFTNTFAAHKNISKYYDISPTSGIPILNSQGSALFNIDRTHLPQKEVMSVSEALLKLVAIIFSLIFLNFCVEEIAERKGFKRGLIILVSVLALIRFLTYFFPFPFPFRQYELFSPAIFSSSFLHPSLGALLINSLLFLWIIKYIRYRYKFNEPLFTNRFRKYEGYLGLVIFVFLSFYIISLINTLVVDSRIPFNVINFFELNIYTIVSFFIIATLILIFYNASYIFLFFVKRSNIKLWIQLGVLACCCLVIYYLIPNNFSLFLKVGAFIWFCGYLSYLHFNFSVLKPTFFIRSPYFLFWVIFYAASATFVMLDEGEKAKVRVQNIIENVLHKSINIDGNTVKLSTDDIPDWFLETNFSRFFDSIQNKKMKDSIYQNNLSAYYNSIDVNILTYDSSGNPLYNDQNIDIHVLDEKIRSKGEEQEAKGLFFVASDTSETAYIYKKQIKLNNHNYGYFYLYMPIRDYDNNNNSQYTRLLMPQSSLHNLVGAYYIGIYKDDKIVNETEKYDFPKFIHSSLLNIGELNTDIKFSGNYYWYKANNYTTVLLVDKNSFIYEYLALFSYLVGSTVVFILLIYIVYSLINARFKWRPLHRRIQFSLRTRIYTTIIFVSLFSLLIIGGSTISFYILNYESENKGRLNRVITRFTREAEMELNQMKKEDSENENVENQITRTILKLAMISNENINYYSSRGKLIATSQPFIYSNKILSNQMNPIAFAEMRQSLKEYYHTEEIEDFSFLSGYRPIQFKEENVGYINVPFLSIRSQLETNISSFITVIICILALVFMLAGLLSIYLTQRITNSLQVIRDEMQKINLGDTSRKITWHRNDEIGAVIKEYNNMLIKLQEFTSQLAKSEREGAWSQMARQVAHEIKNPLTPMKLNIQFLERLSEFNDEESKKKVKRISESLIEQIDQLALIAGDFSQFANIGQIRLERFRVSDIIPKLIDIYNVREGLEITFTKAGNDLIYFDKTQIHRLFSNLIKNGIEASGDIAKIEIAIQDFNNTVLISVKDFGIGITNKEATKIFTPNFTTKSSGTGLGLAICKVIVENAKGRIWFESVPKKGTIFYVSLPLYRP